MVKRRKNGNLFLLIITGVMLLSGLFFVTDFPASFMLETMIFAGLLLVVGIAYLAFYSSVSSAATGDWPIIEGLTNVLLAIVLFMSMSTSQTDMVLYILSIWALTGAVSRFICALKLNKNAKKQAFFNAGACLLSALLMFIMTIATRLVPQIVAGAGIIIYSFGSFVSPKKVFAAKGKAA